MYYCLIPKKQKWNTVSYRVPSGTIVNALTSVKHFINGNKVSGLIVAVVAVMLAIMTVITALIVL